MNRRHDHGQYLAEIRRIVDRAPKPTAAQRDLITAVLRPATRSHAAEWTAESPA